jgi:hypothetical protein
VAAGKEMGAAEYFVTLVPTRTGVTVEGAKFISGDPGMKVYTEALRHAKFSQAFPDDSQTKIVRRGVLSCSQSAGCHFVMMLPDDVRSTE